MKKYSYEEFVRVDDSFAEGKLDFYGELSPLSVEEQKTFLEKYVDYHKKRFGENASYEKAVDRAEAEACAERLQLRGKNALKWTAYKRKKAYVYEGWQLYSDRAVVEDGTLVLKDSFAWPIPCAKYELTNESVQELAFLVKISGQYKAPVYAGLMSTTTGRYVELRAGCKEIIKLYFSPNGFFIYKDSRVNTYRYESHAIGKYNFDEWNEVKIKRTETGFSLSFNGETQEFERDLSGIDNLFIGGGMQPADFWAVKPVYFKSDKREVKDFFVKSTSYQEKDLCVGEVTLPFALGTERNADYSLVLKSKLRCVKNKAYKLEIDALDPGGDVFINGTLVAHKDGFQPFAIDVTPFVQEGENDLEIVVYPRAPESLFNWHKHDDYYNGWFCQGVNVVESAAYSEATLEVETRNTGERTAFDVIVKNASFTGVETGSVSYKIYLQKIYPLVGEKALLAGGGLEGAYLCRSFLEAVELWSPKNPVLYEVCVEFYQGERRIYEIKTETGFRTISQKDGEMFLNGEKIVLKGALTMQFLPPYEEVPLNHICPSDRQIVEQILMLKAMNGNCLRMHQLGYGTNDKRFARACDRLGVLLIWTTRLIDSAENMQWSEDWKQAKDYQQQILQVKNHPSIIIWEGSNEGHLVPPLIDRIYDAFVTAVKEVDATRLLCPVSHLYYSWGDEGEKCGYYTNDGKKNEMDEDVCSSFGWRDELVIRSAHPYGILLGYGQPWQHMVTQCYKFQNDLLSGCDKAYIASEFAIIGRQNPNTPEAKEFINKNSYEFNDEKTALGFIFTDEEWEISQAFQALCAAVATKQLRRLGADGMLWCCLTGGANNASYLKPIIDFYGYKKLAFYQLKEAFQDVTAFNENPDLLFHRGYPLSPIVVGAVKGKKYALRAEFLDETGKVSAVRDFDKYTVKEDNLHFNSWQIELPSGYYTIRYTVSEE